MNFIAKLLTILHSDASNKQIAAGLCLGFLMGFSPLLSLQGLLLLLVAFTVRIQFGSFMLAWALFSLLALLLRGLALSVGESVLLHDGAQTLLQSFYSSQLIQLTWFNHTRVMGELTIALISLPLVAPLLYWLVAQYRQTAMVWLKKQPVVQFLKTFRLVQIFLPSKGI